MDEKSRAEFVKDAVRDNPRLGKLHAARASVVSAVFLTLMKGVVGFMTGSLGILAEAAHSLLDLGAAVMTYFSVKISDLPADEQHHYGHGKIENLSALGETLLLMATCVWIVYEAVDRLFGKGGVQIEASIWGFAVMGISIGVDAYRSRRLMRAAKLHKSAALEADALHFSSDILSSAVVIGGLVAVRLGYPQADPIAALAVAGWVFGIGTRMGMQSIQALLDRAPAHARESVKTAVESVQGVRRAQGIRVREAGPSTFAEVTVMLDPQLTLAQAHNLSDRAEDAVRELFPGADVIVHAEPSRPPTRIPEPAGPIQDGFRAASFELGIPFHSLRIFEGEQGMTALVDLEFPPGLSLREARQRADAFEEAVMRRTRSLAEVVAHIDVDYGELDRITGARTPTPNSELAEAIEKVSLDVPGVTGCHDIIVNLLQPGDKALEGKGAAARPPGLSYIASLHLLVSEDMTVAQSHDIALEVEKAVCAKVPQILKVHVHQESA